jgi:thiol-disulfide isomerase/thioredoxin
VLVVYFAAWCHNWKYQAPAVQKFYEKYKANGLDVIAVAEYETVELTQKHYQEKKFTFPVVFESTELSARLNTPHYDYRKKTGDTRKWGSPWNLFLETANLRPDGDTLLKKAFVANGELVEADVEKFIREKLGLPAVESKAVSSAEKKEIEACEPAKDFKKPPR